MFSKMVPRPYGVIAGMVLVCKKLEKLGIETVIISTEVNSVVSTRAHKLKIRCVQDCQDKWA